MFCLRMRGGLKPALLLLACLTMRAADPAIHWLAGAVEVINVAAGESGVSPAEALVVFAEQEHATMVPPIAGTTRRIGDRLRFEPRFPFTPGVAYRAEFRPAGRPVVVARFRVPVDNAPPSTVVREIYPTARELPENHLKFYVHFSAPMSRGGAYQHLRLQAAGGEPVELPFLELDEELWDPSMTRLTLLIDPGRIKRGVKPLEDIGPVFELGKTYTLTVDAGCRDASDRPLAAEYRRTFRVTAADRSPPDPSNWKVTPPRAGTCEPLVVDFDKPMDHALALRLIRVRGESGNVAGEANLTDAERRWTFVPQHAWPSGAHAVVVATTIEDLAGNNIGKTFDVDLFEGVQRRIATPSVSVAFTVE